MGRSGMTGFFADSLPGSLIPVKLERRAAQELIQVKALAPASRIL